MLMRTTGNRRVMASVGLSLLSGVACCVAGCLGPATPQGQTGFGYQAREPLPELYRVLMRTSKGDILLELDRTRSPITVDNFLRYVDDGFYTGTIFHRVVQSGIFVIQGGGFLEDGSEKTTRNPIVLEDNNGRSNLRATLAMARTNAPDSGTSQFYINTQDNTNLDRAGNQRGYAVFGVVLEGMDVVDAIAAEPLLDRGGAFSERPEVDVVIFSVERVN